MQNLTGFIVSVKPKGNEPIDYKYNNEIRTLLPDEDFIGYFWVMSNTDKTDPPHFAGIHKIALVSNQGHFKYEKEAWFDIEKVNISIIAKRGPESNNRFLPKEYDGFETWNAIN